MLSMDMLSDFVQDVVYLTDSIILYINPKCDNASMR